MDFVVIDFETANDYRGSACSLGILEIENLQLKRAKHFLIKPTPLVFQPTNIRIHGITLNQVADAPDFGQLYQQELFDLLHQKTVVAHNAANFDISVLRHCLNEYTLTYPDIRYGCTKELCRRLYPEMESYKLSELCASMGLHLEKHHHALYDAIACASILTKVMLDQDQLDLSKLLNLKPLEFQPTRRAFEFTPTVSADDPIHTDKVIDQEGEFLQIEGRCFCFTGELEKFSREGAWQEVEHKGGFISKGVTMKTNYLVLGQQDWLRYGIGHKSGKAKKAEEYRDKGFDIKIISENDFYNILKNEEYCYK